MKLAFTPLCRRAACAAAAAAAAAFCFLSAPTSAAVSTPIDPSWKLTFDDEFNGTSLAKSRWNVGNDSLGEGPFTLIEWRGENVTVANGSAVLAVTEPTGGTPRGRRYGASNINTNFSQRYGYWEARIKMPESQPGMYTGFWMNLPGWHFPEIDVFEWLGIDPTTVWTHIHYHNLEPVPDNHGAGYGTGYRGSADLSGDYHVYGMLWTPTEVICYLDGSPIWQTSKGLDDKPGDMRLDEQGKPAAMWTILTNCIGGWDNNVALDTTPFPSSMYVDYVHIYSNNPAATAAAPDRNYGGPGDTEPIIDASFERGAKWPMAWGNASVAAGNAFSGKYAAKFTGQGAQEQIIGGLLPNTTYTLSCHAMTSRTDSRVVLGVKNYGGPELRTPIVAPSYALASVSFTTGPKDTAADIYVYSDPGTGVTTVDDFALTYIKSRSRPKPLEKSRPDLHLKPVGASPAS